MERRAYLLADGRTVTVTVDRLARQATFSMSGAAPFSMHLMQAYHLAKFLFGFEIGEARGRVEYEHEDDDTLPGGPLSFDLSDQKTD